MTADDQTPTDAAVDRMWADARHGRPVRADAQLVSSTDPDGAVDLVYAEFIIRSELGEPPTADELAGRFPHLADRIRRQLALHNALESDADTRAYSGTPPHAPGDGTADPDNPTHIGRYKVLNRLGRGGQATAYRAFHPDLHRDVAIKLAHTPAGGSADALRAEARLVATLDHPGLVRVFDFDLADGRPFIVMEYVPARTLAAEVAAAPVPPARAAGIVAAAARACAHAHRGGVVHRDLKPENVLLDPAGGVRVIDFGLAALLGRGEEEYSSAGTVRYMAPEQAGGGGPVTPRTDVFGLGGLLYFLLTGSPLYPGDQFEAFPRAAACDWDRAKLAACPATPRLKAVCAKALATDPAERYATADELADALGRAVRPWWPLGVGVGVLLALAVALALAAAMWPKPPVPTAAATQPESPPPQSDLTVRVWADHQGRYIDLVRTLPLLAGEKVRVDFDAPAGRHLTLFLIDSAGVQALAEYPPGDARTVGFPTDPGQKVPLTPPGGTAVFLMCGRVGGPVSADDVRAAVGAEAWPVLPGMSWVKVERAKVTVGGGKGVGPAEGQPDPEGEVVRRLDAARGRLAERYDALAGVAVAHP